MRLRRKPTKCEETHGVPLIAGGDSFSESAVVDIPADLIGICPFIVDCVGEGDAGMVENDASGRRPASAGPTRRSASADVRAAAVPRDVGV